MAAASEDMADVTAQETPAPVAVKGRNSKSRKKSSSTRKTTGKRRATEDAAMEDSPADSGMSAGNDTAVDAAANGDDDQGFDTSVKASTKTVMSRAKTDVVVETQQRAGKRVRPSVLSVYQVRGIPTSHPFMASALVVAYTEQQALELAYGNRLAEDPDATKLMTVSLLDLMRPTPSAVPVGFGQLIQADPAALGVAGDGEEEDAAGSAQPNTIYICTDYESVPPVPPVAVVIAPSEAVARDKMAMALLADGVQNLDCTVQEMPTVPDTFVWLSTGEMYEGPARAAAAVGVTGVTYPTHTVYDYSQIGAGHVMQRVD